VAGFFGPKVPGPYMQVGNKHDRKMNMLIAQGIAPDIQNQLLVHTDSPWDEGNG
jgi:hypothetical protein